MLCSLYIVEQVVQSQLVLTFFGGGVHEGIANYIEVTNHNYISVSQVINLLVEVSEKAELSGVWAVYVDQGVGGLSDGAN